MPPVFGVEPRGEIGESIAPVAQSKTGDKRVFANTVEYTGCGEVELS